MVILSWSFLTLKIENHLLCDYGTQIKYYYKYNDSTKINMPLHSLYSTNSSKIL